MNTKVLYMYRDAANYKIHCEEVVRGEIDDKTKEELLEYSDCRPFYPNAIGFSADNFVTEGYAPYPDDPDFHELCDFELTDEEATVDMSIEEFVNAVKSGVTQNPTSADTATASEPTPKDAPSHGMFIPCKPGDKLGYISQ